MDDVVSKRDKILAPMIVVSKVSEELYELIRSSAAQHGTLEEGNHTMSDFKDLIKRLDKKTELLDDDQTATCYKIVDTLSQKVEIYRHELAGLKDLESRTASAMIEMERMQDEDKDLGKNVTSIPQLDRQKSHLIGYEIIGTIQSYRQATQKNLQQAENILLFLTPLMRIIETRKIMQRIRETLSVKCPPEADEKRTLVKHVR